VALRRTGGLEGSTQDFGAARDSAGSAELFTLVDGAEFKALAPDYPVPDECCDRFRYTLTVDYRGGSKKVTTITGADAPQVLWKAVKLLAG
jgi:hypothetical protein